MFQQSKSFDPWILIASALLILFGVFNLFGIKPELLPTYLGYSVIGFLLFVLANRAGLHIFKQNYIPIYVGFIFLFILTMIIGDNVRGSKRWIDLYFFNFQTSEIFKPFFLVVLAEIFSQKDRFSLKSFAKIMLIAGIPLIIIFKQPDLGTAILYTAVVGALFYFAGSSYTLIRNIGLAMVMIVPFGWHLLKDYQKLRLIGFLNPEIDPQGFSYNLQQAMITIGSGGFFGKGLGLGTQARYRFLPEYHTDFAFASFVEQFGLFGGILLLSVYAFLLFRLVKHLFSVRDSLFHYLFTIGVIVFFAFSILVNVGMNMGIMPVTGIALPFISYGGSSIVAYMVLLGLATTR